MNEIVRDDAKGVDVIVAEDREKRPHLKGREGCIFCRGSEDRTPPTLAAYPNEKEWRVRRFRNAFPALSPSTKKFAWRRNRAPAIGAHDVIVETEKHSQSFQDFSRGHLELVWEAYRDAFAEHAEHRGTKFVFLMRNRGLSAGASIPHEHAQILSLPFVPRYIAGEMRAKKCGFCKPEKIGKLLFERKGFACVLPFAPRFPCESWIIPKRHARVLTDLTDCEGVAFLEALQEALKRTSVYTEEYNVAFHCAPRGGDLHLHAEIYPRKNIWAAVEYGTGLVLNPVGTKQALKILSRVSP
ncbi:MAG: hypothetical protein WC607_02900 [Candidatus Micrarchaeia archaeon]